MVQQIIDHAMADAEALHTGGIDAIMVENYGDVPFRKSGLEPHTIALMGLIATQVKQATQLPLGINALRNDPLAALGIAAACGGAMIRVNVHTAAMVTDQGIIEGNARGTIDYRTTLGVAVKVMAYVNVKHALPLVPFPIEELAASLAEFVRGTPVLRDQRFSCLRRSDGERRILSLNASPQTTGTGGKSRSV